MKNAPFLLAEPASLQPVLYSKARMQTPRLSALLLLLTCTLALRAQERQQYSHLNTYSLFVEYSNNSSHIILGSAENRRIAALGLTYSRRLLHTRYADWNYDLALRPLTFIQNPTATASLSWFGVVQDGPVPLTCVPLIEPTFAIPLLGIPAGTYTVTCGTRWTYAGGVSPLGQRINLAPHHRLQPFFIGNGGFLASPRDLPTNLTTRFNFTFEFGGGLEFFRDHRHAWAVEYRLHHLSNAHLGLENPGVDNQLIMLTYSFGH